MIKQESISIELASSKTISKSKKQLISGQFKQVQAYHNNTNASLMLYVTINDASDSPLISKQPLDNLRSRDGAYFANMPFTGMSGTDVSVIIESSEAPTEAINVSIVFDIESNC